MLTKTKRQLYKEYIDYLEIKYKLAYIGTMYKLNAKDQFDNKGILKPEYVLTEQERETLLFYKI